MKYSFEDVIKFHGHSCPGLALGYRVALTAIEELGLNQRAYDEEIVCIVENDTCAVDAIQVITGCTFGKGNLIFKDYGKQVYTFFNRKHNKAIRISVEFEFKESDEEKALWQRFIEGERDKEIIEFIEKRKLQKIEQILKKPDNQLFKITYPIIAPPKQAKIFKTIRCENCQEKVAEVKARLLKGKILCIPCFEELI